MYDHIAVYYDLTHAKLTADRDFLLDLAQRTGGPILEIGCGSGRLLLPLAEAGFDVTGLDNSAVMLARAQKRLSAQLLAVQNRICLVETDALKWQNAGSQFALIIIPYNTLMHFDPQQLPVLLKRLSAWLGANGRLFIDLENPFTIAAATSQNEFLLEGQFEDPESNTHVQQFSRSELDTEAQKLDVIWKYVAAGNGRNTHTTEVAMTYHYWFPHQLEMALTRAGLRLSAMWGGYGRIPFTENSPRLLLLV